MNSRCPIELTGIEPVRRIGVGGFGEVWLARQTDFDRDVALKVGRRAFTSLDDRLRFERECKALGRLTGHPHVIGVHTSGFQDDLPYLVMEFVEGGTLADHGPSLTEAELVTIGMQLCEAVAAAHEIGVLHRDLKPENVFLRNDRTAVLGDFGIARLGDGNDTAAGGLTATLAYAAPEVLNGHPPSVQADVYGIGITLAAAAMGNSPYAPSTEMAPEAIMAKVFEGAPPDLGSHGMSPGFTDAVQQAMHRDPSRRPRSAAALGALLQSLPAGGGRPAHGQAPANHGPATAGHDPTTVVPSPTPPLQHGTPPQTPSRSAVPAILAAVGVVIVALLATVTLLNRGDDPEPTQTSAAGEVDDQQGPTTTSTAETTTSTLATTTALETTAQTAAADTTPSAPPLAMPLSATDVTELTDIPIDEQGWDEILGPANSPQFCDVRPDVTGLVETMAALYPVDPTVGGNLQQVTVRMHRFDDPDRAATFVESATEVTCDSWESDGSRLRAVVTEPLNRYGDETRQVDQVIEPQDGVAILTRSVFVRSGADVMKLVLLTIDPTDLDPVADGLVARAVDSLGYGAP